MAVLVIRVAVLVKDEERARNHYRRRFPLPSNPVEELGGAIDLIVVAGIGEAEELVEILGEPGRILRKQDLTGFEGGRLPLHAGELVPFGLDADRGGDARRLVVLQLLNQLLSDAGFLDQDRLGIVIAGLGGDHRPELGELQLAAPDVDQIVGLPVDEPCGADGVVAGLVHCGRHIPALDDARPVRRVNQDESVASIKMRIPLGGNAGRA